jgi:hypothetical protein
LTLEHRHPFSLGGPDTLENLCLFCKAHNAHTARNVFGDEFIARKITTRETHTASADDVARSPTSETVGTSATDSDAFAKVRWALTHMGFPPRAVTTTLTRLHPRPTRARTRTPAEGSPQPADTASDVASLSC